MNEFRVFIAVLVFSISTYLVYDLIVNGFNWVLLFFCIGGYISVHYIWPKKSDDESLWFEALEFIFDFPFRVISGHLRTVGRTVNKVDDFDL